jgi:hypothetical protein
MAHIVTGRYFGSVFKVNFCQTSSEIHVVVVALVPFRGGRAPAEDRLHAGSTLGTSDINYCRVEHSRRGYDSTGLSSVAGSYNR